jgi:NADPH-dependent glutamate synthase beta subunit-like oxidoreductase
VAVYLKGELFENTVRLPEYGNVATAQEVIVIGAGPAGLFAALR